MANTTKQKRKRVPSETKPQVLNREQVQKLMEQQAQDGLGVSAKKALTDARTGKGQTLMHSHLSMLATALKFSSR